VLKTMNNATLGNILADDKGKTVYTFDVATAPAAKDPSKCTGACLGPWPPVLSSDVPTAPAGVTGKFALITRADANNVKQVTFNDLPLYYFVQDTAPGDAKGQNSKGFNGNWQVVKAS
jgi:predicted lipoprotein with Yx(FWY)xxD motif